MEAEDEQQTQEATQNIVDPRRRGQQYSGFSDDDISDIVCVLHPHSNHARREITRIAREGSPHIFGRDEVDNVDADFSLEDKASRFEMAPPALGNHVIVLRLSAAMKDPELGFTFGRNTARCDLCFAHDPCRRLSNIHFRVFVNEFGVVMLEDQSTNGTIVDTVLLKSKAHPPTQKKRMLASGSRVKVLMHQEDMDLEFMVRIPRREGAYDAAYRDRLNDYFARLAALRTKPTTITPGPGGPPNLFAAPSGQAARRTPLLPNGRGSATPPSNQRTRAIIPMEWDGSDKYNRVGVIGKGAFAVVYQVTSKSDGSPYAAKELEKRHFMKNGVLDQKVENEMNIMKELQHPNIVRYIENFDWDDRLLIIIMEFIGGGDLGKFVHTQGPLPETVVQTMAIQLLDAFEYLHERGVTHRDVKPDNILISSMDPFEIKLTDFGLSKMVNNEETFLRTFCGTLLYCAPEVYTEFVEYDHFGRRNPRLRGRRAAVGQRYDHAVDVWSLGGVLFFALTGKPPYPVQSGVSYSELLHRIMTMELDVTPLHRAGVSSDAIEFLRLMLQRRPEIRSTVAELKGHPWLGGPRKTVNPAESLDEFTDEELPVDASQLSLEDGQAAQMVQGDARPDSEILINHNDLDGYSDTSEKENTIRGLRDSKTPQPLFGEVNVSAVGSSGGIPEHRLNLRVTDPSDSTAETVILDSQDPGNFDDSDHFTPHKRQPHEGGHLSVGAHNQSADQLQSLVENVQSQSLGVAESVGGSAVRGDAASSPPASLALPQPPEFTASKRKPNYDTSDEFEGGSGPGRPSFKRLKSDVDLDSLTDEMLEEYKLIASVPPVRRLESGRQIDRPVHKTTFWDRKDPSTHHVNYPEMTQLQLDVFAQAARERGEKFEPGASPLWDLAMKYFPPTDWSAVEGGKENDPTRASTPQTLLGRDSRRLTSDAGAEVPSTAPVRVPSSSSSEDSIPDTAPHDGNIIVPIREDPSQSRIVALFESAPSSAVQGISIPVAGPILSWGRGGDNTHVYGERSEARVPKCAFKALLYKEGYDASKDRDRQPWLRPRADEGEFAFYLCTKATSGIWVNGRRLLSHDSRRPASPAHHWVRLYTGDDLVVWGDPSDDGGAKTRVAFKAFWGASAGERAEPPVAVHAGLARRLDEVCLRAERRTRSEGEYKARMEEAVGEHAVRERFVGVERGRSKGFEGVRRGAVEVVSLARSVGRA